MSYGRTYQWFIIISQILLTCLSEKLHFNSHQSNYDIIFNQSNQTSRNSLIFAGLFPIHSRGSGTEFCGKINIERGIHRWQAMLFAVKQINENPNILPGIPIEIDVHDTCQKDTVALESLVKTVIKKVHRGNTKECLNELQEASAQVAGVIGAASSSVSIEVANLLRLFKLPQISYASTSAILNNRKKYGYFARTVPPDSQQANALTDLMKHMNWSSVFILYSEGTYGEGGFESLKLEAKHKQICIVDHFKISSQTNISEILIKMKTNVNTQLVILFLRIPHIKKLLKTVSQTNLHFTWLASDYWGTRNVFLNTPQLQKAANNAITLTLKSNYSYERFRNYFCSLKPVALDETTRNRTNEWFNEYWMEKYNCSISEAHCLDIPICQTVQFDDKIPYVIDAVYALASAVDSYLKTVCTGRCNGPVLLNGDQILHSLLTTEYEGVYGKTRFDKDGSASHGYDIMRYVDKKYTRVGGWNCDEKLILNNDLTTYGSSFCSRQCNVPGYIKRSIEGSPDCCYDCIECAMNQYAENNTCQTCPPSYHPNTKRNGCQELPIRHLNRQGVIIVACLASIGLILTTFVAVTFYYFRDTEVVRTAAPELSFPLLIGLLLCHALAFIIVADQTKVTCLIRRFGVGFSFCICYSSLLTKINRLERVFKYNKHGRSRRGPRFISAYSQLVIMAAIVFVEASLIFIGLIKYRTRLKTIEINFEVLYLCHVPIYDQIISLGYNVLLVLICTIYAFRTRKVHPAFNEARYIGFVMYTTAVIWITYVLLYIIDVSEESKVIALGVNVIINALSILAFLFGPKLYIIIFRPSRNRRASSLSSLSQSHSLSCSHSLTETERSRISPKKRSQSIYSDVSRYPNKHEYNL